jgi:hypothetical protein
MRENAGQERGEADAHRLDQSHALNLWISNRVRDAALVRP